MPELTYFQKRACVICKKEIPVITLRQKYCDSCQLKIQRQKTKDWHKLHPTTRKAYDLFCITCNKSIPIGSTNAQLFCESCIKERVKKQHNGYYRNRKTIKLLNNFYKNLQFNFIQSPYFRSDKLSM